MENYISYQVPTHPITPPCLRCPSPSGSYTLQLQIVFSLQSQTRLSSSGSNHILTSPRTHSIKPSKGHGGAYVTRMYIFTIIIIITANMLDSSSQFCVSGNPRRARDGRQRLSFRTRNLEIKRRHLQTAQDLRWYSVIERWQKPVKRSVK